MLDALCGLGRVGRVSGSRDGSFDRSVLQISRQQPVTRSPKYEASIFAESVYLKVVRAVSSYGSITNISLIFYISFLFCFVLSCFGASKGYG